MIDASYTVQENEEMYNFWNGCDIDRRRRVERVLVVCSTDGRLHVYFDERYRTKERKFNR